MKAIMISIAALASFGLNAAAQSDTYTVNLATSQVDLSCTVSTAGQGSQQCSINESTQGQVAVTMNPIQTPTGGYLGVDEVIDGGTAVYALIIDADASKNIKGLGLAREQVSADGSSMDFGLSIVDTTGVKAVNISPLNIQIIDAQTTALKMTVFAYAPSGTANMVTAKDHQALVDYVLEKVKPAVAIARHQNLQKH